jgi:antirestriction protein ArdC
MTAKQDTVYQIVTDRIVAQLEQGTVPWRRPWVAGQVPTNLVSGKPYRGINTLLLAMSGHDSQYWLSFKQMDQLGGHLRKINGPDEKGTGQESTIVVFWQMVKRNKGADPDDLLPLLRYYRVFNLDQTEGVRIPRGRIIDPDDHDGMVIDPIETAEAIVDGYPEPPRIQQGEPQAWYRASDDLVNMPQQKLFRGADEWYAALFHELGHSTGHVSRLGREAVGTTFFGSHDYGREELVAELTSAFLASIAGIDTTTDNSAAYLDSWIRAIREDVRAVVVAAGQAQKAADHILGRTPADYADTAGNTSSALAF